VAHEGSNFAVGTGWVRVESACILDGERERDNTPMEMHLLIRRVK
jgi:hypothetical protein